MADIIAKRQCAELDGEFVVFLIGMRINKFWKIWRWLPVAQAMPRMLIELGKHRSSACCTPAAISDCAT